MHARSFIINFAKIHRTIEHRTMHYHYITLFTIMVLFYIKKLLFQGINHLR